MTLGDITSRLVLNTKGFSSGLRTAEDEAKGMSKRAGGSIVGKLGGAFTNVAKVATAAVGTAAVGVAGIATASLNAYAETEQLVGGVQKLFEDSSDAVIKNAEQAYKTAGMSANDYMETVTGFSASLLQSVGGDTVQAASIADQAIRDMSDNANTFGTDISAIQNAYQGFAKGNFTMLDNLKLGYGGTQGEMARLLNEAGVLEDGIVATAENVNSIGFDKYIKAIHKVQEEQNIAGTTAKEASETIAGSISSAKASWTDLLSALASGDMDRMDQAFENFADSISTAFTNIVKIIPNILNGLVRAIEKVFTEIDFSVLINTILSLIPRLLEVGKTIILQLANALRENLPMIVETALSIVQTLIETIVELLPIVIEMGIGVIVALLEGLTEAIPDLIPVIVDAIMLILDTLVENLPLILEAGIELLLALLNGIIDALPQLIEYIPVLIESLVAAIMQMLPLIIYAALQIIVALGRGLVVALPMLIGMIPQIVFAIAHGIVDSIPVMMQTGRRLIQGLWEGIANADQWIRDKISRWVGNITSFFKREFGIASPSKLMKDEIGMNLGLGVAEGIKNSIGKVEGAMGALSDVVGATVSPNVSIAGAGVSAVNIGINLDGAIISSESDAEAYAERIGDHIMSKLRRTYRQGG